MRKLDHVVNELLENDGTVPVAHVSVPTSGYVVGVNGQGLQYDGQAISAEEVKAWARKVRPQAAQPGRFLGSWLDSETGTRYLDLVEVYAERARAEDIGKARGELAVWDLAGNSEIRLDS